MPVVAMNTARTMATQKIATRILSTRAADTMAASRMVVRSGAWTQQRRRNFWTRSAHTTTTTGEVRGVHKDVPRTTNKPRTHGLTRSVVSARIQASRANGEQVWRKSSEFWQDRVLARLRSIQWAKQYCIELQRKRPARRVPCNCSVSIFSSGNYVMAPNSSSAASARVAVAITLQSVNT